MRKVVCSQKKSGIRARSMAHPLVGKIGERRGTKCISQLGKHLLRRLGIVDGLFFQLGARSHEPQPNQVQRLAECPALWQVLLDINVVGSDRLARVANTSDNLLDRCLVDKVVEPQLIGVLELEFVVVGKEADEGKGFEDRARLLGLSNKLGRCELRFVVEKCWQRTERTFMMEGNRSRCIMYVRSVVWYAPAVVARRTSIALCRISTGSVSLDASSER